MITAPAAGGSAATDALRLALRAQGLVLGHPAWLDAVPVQRVGADLVADDPAQAAMDAEAWAGVQIARGPGQALVLGCVGRGLRSRRWRCFVATPALVLALERVLPLIGDDVAASQAACNAALQLADRALAAAAAHRGERLVMVHVEGHGALVTTASRWPQAPSRLRPDPLAWLQLLDRLPAQAA